jgi:hypothetical protein
MVSKFVVILWRIFNFLDSLNFLPMSLKRMPRSFDLSCKKGFYPHFFDTVSNLDYEVPYPEPAHYGSDCMSEYERSEFLARLEEQKLIHSITRLNCWLTEWMTLTYLGRHAVHSGICF